MNRSRALELLTQSKPTLSSRYGVTQLALFGSSSVIDHEADAAFRLGWRR